MVTTGQESPPRFNDNASIENERPVTRMVLTRYATFLKSLNRRTATIEQRVGDIERFRSHYPDLFTVRFEDILDYYAAHPTWSAEYRKKIRSSLIVFYRWAERYGYTSHNPTLELEPFTIPKRDPRPTPENVVLDAFEDGTLAERAIVLLAATMGLRRTEIATLHPSNRNGSQLFIDGKGGKARMLPLDPLTQEFLVLIEIEQGTDTYYFPGRFGGHLHSSTVYRWIKNHVGEMWNLHSFRTRCATEALRRTGNIRAVQEFLGHASVNTTQRYTAVNDRELAGVSNATSLAYSVTNRKVVGQHGVPNRADQINDHQKFLEDLASVTARASHFGIELTLR